MSLKIGKSSVAPIVFILVALLFSTTLHAERIFPPIVETTQLLAHSQFNEIVFVDARTETAFKQGHIKNAVNIPVASTYSPTDQIARVGSISHIQKLFGKSGIGNKDIVVIYDDGEFIDAARTMWVFEAYGHQQVSVLRDGYSNGIVAGLINDTQDAVRPEKLYIAAIKPEKMSTKLSTRIAIEDDNKLIVDARSAQEYSGAESKSARFGRIPRAVSIPWTENISSDNGTPKIKSFDELTQVYSKLDRSKKIITYCNKGKQSSLTYLVLRQLGYNTAHYDGSWNEWGNDPNLPIEN